jgi:hypothetical protein
MRRVLAQHRFCGASARVNPNLVAFYERNARTAQTVGR